MRVLIVDDERIARNRLRALVWPALTKAFADAEASLATAARWAQEASAGLAELAAIDVATLCGDGTLDLAAWRGLSPVRQSNALRAWLRESIGRAPIATLVERLMKELRSPGAMRWPLPGGELRSYRGRLRYEATTIAPSAPARPVIGGELESIDLSAPGVHEQREWGGAFVVERVVAGGIPAATASRLALRARVPGDRFQAGPARPPRGLKLQYQAAGVPAWLRHGPLACHDGVPVYVPGLGIDARALARPGEPQLSLRWLPR